MLEDDVAKENVEQSMRVLEGEGVCFLRRVRCRGLTEGDIRPKTEWEVPSFLAPCPLSSFICARAAHPGSAHSLVCTLRGLAAVRQAFLWPSPCSLSAFLLLLCSTWPPLPREPSSHVLNPSHVIFSGTLLL